MPKVIQCFIENVGKEALLMGEQIWHVHVAICQRSLNILAIFILSSLLIHTLGIYSKNFEEHVQKCL